MRIFNYPKGKSRMGGKGKLPAKKVPTCTLKFFCLGNTGDEKPPSTIASKTALSNCGLGPGNITFEMNGSSVHPQLLERFPLLSSAGGYELLLHQRGGIDQGFHKIPTPHTPSRIKELASQATIYIRPLQINIEGLESTDKQVLQLSEPSLKVECLQCHKEVDMDKLRCHQEDEHPRKRKHQATLFMDSFSDNDEDENKSAGPSSVPVPTTSRSLTSDEEINHLSEIFPEKSWDTLKACLEVEGSFNKAVTALLPENIVTDDDDDDYLMKSSFEPSEDCSVSQDLKSELQNLQKHFSQDQREKLKIDEEDLLNDAMSYYKDEGFDPRKKLRIVYRGQAAADTGGVIRQFYTQLLSAISDTFFQGDTYRSPVYNCDMVACGVMKLVGTIIVHSILQGGPGFPVFSPAVYNYLAKADLNEAMTGVTVKDCSIQMQYFISKVAQAVDVSDLDKDEITNVLSNCGLTMILTNDNKMRVIQSLIVHDTIGKPKILLDQLREGLQTLGFGSRLQLYPELFKELFVAGEKELQGSYVREILVFPPEMSDDERNIMDHMSEFIVTATPTVLKAFLTFSTGAPCLPEFGLGRIRIVFDDIGSIFSSTCLKKVTLPRNFPDKNTFLAAIQAVCDNGGKAFTSV